MVFIFNKNLFSNFFPEFHFIGLFKFGEFHILKKCIIKLIYIMCNHLNP